MAYQYTQVLVLIILLTYTPPPAAALSPEAKTAIEKGIDAGKALAEALKDGDFRDSLVKLGKNLAPFLGVLGPLASIALGFIPSGDSAELKFMKEKFGEVNNKLDVITEEFKEVKGAIDWSTVTVSYGTYERKIRAAEYNLNQFYEADKNRDKRERLNPVEAAKDHFLRSFDSDFDNSLQKLYDVIMYNDHVFSKNVLEAVIMQTKSHRRKFEAFSLGLVQLLLQGIKVKISAFAMRGYSEQAVEVVKKDWTKNMDALRRRLEEKDNAITNNYKTQMESDVKDIILRNARELDNKALMDLIYDFVVGKFEYRLWFVAVYDDMTGFDKHAIQHCGGGAFLHQLGKKNVIVASQDKAYANRFSQNAAKKVVSDLRKRVYACDSALINDNSKGRALALVNSMGSIAGNGCVPYALRMAVETGKGLWYRSYESHRYFEAFEARKRCGRKTLFYKRNIVIFG